MVKKTRYQDPENAPYEEIMYEINDNEKIICQATPSTAETTAEWRIYKQTTSVIVGATKSVIRYANNNPNFIFQADSATALSLTFPNP